MVHEHQDERRNVVGNLIALLRVEADRLELQRALSDHEAADIAEALDDVTADVKHTILETLAVSQRADVLDEIGGEEVEEYLGDAPVSEVVEIVDTLPADEAADLLELVSDSRVEEVIAKLAPDLAEDVRELREYAPETAGGIMTTEFFWAKPEETAQKIIRRLKDEYEEVETIHEIFVCREDMKLKGLVSVADLITAEPEKTAADLMDTATITIGARTDQEVAARYMQKYDLEILAVIDPGRRLLGIITVDDIIDVLTDEASEDMYRMAGVGDPKPLEHGTMERAYKRLPWLVTTIVGMGVIGPFLLEALFAETLKSVVALALFIPAIMGLGGNTAMQSSTITVRGLATGELDKDDMWWLLWREIKVALVIALSCSIVVGGCAYGMMRLGQEATADPVHASEVAAPGGEASVEAEKETPPHWFAFTVAAALFVGILASVMLGVIVPMICHRSGVDPAVAAGPFITTLIDIGTQTLYLGIATWLLLS